MTRGRSIPCRCTSVSCYSYRGSQTGIVTRLDGGRASNHTPSATWADRTVTVAAWVTVGVIVLAGALILWLRHTTGMIDKPAPNPAAYARSTPVRGADAADESWLGRQFAGVLEKAPWLIPAGSSVFDVCSVEGGAPGLFGGGTGYGFYCSRTGTRYYAYGSPGAARVRELRRALRGLGWAGFESHRQSGEPCARTRGRAVARRAGPQYLSRGHEAEPGCHPRSAHPGARPPADHLDHRRLRDAPTGLGNRVSRVRRPAPRRCPRAGSRSPRPATAAGSPARWTRCRCSPRQPRVSARARARSSRRAGARRRPGPR